MFLKNYEASNGDVRFLEEAHSQAMAIFFQDHPLDVRLSAATIAVAAGYVHMGKASVSCSAILVKMFAPRRAMCHSGHVFSYDLRTLDRSGCFAAVSIVPSLCCQVLCNITSW